MSSTPSLDLSIIIISYNTSDLLDKCLASIYSRPQLLEFEVIVVDNASADGSAAMVERKYPLVRLVANAANRGYAPANNQGLEICRGRHALLLNSDTEVLADALPALVRYADANPGVGIVGAQLRNTDGTLQPSGNRIPTVLGQVWWSLPFYRLFGSGPLGNRFFDRNRDYEQIADVDEVSGAALLVRREVWESVGMLDVEYFFYFEDVDFCVRAKKAGWRVVYLPSAKILHHWGRSSKKPGMWFYIRSLKSHFHYMRKVHGRFGELAIRAVTAVRVFFKIVVSLFRYPGSPEEQKQNIRVNVAILRLSVGLKTSD